MMRRLFIDFRLGFASNEEAWLSEEILLRFLGLLAMLNLHQIRKYPKLPRLYASGVKYCNPDQMDGSWVPKDKVSGIIRSFKDAGAAPNKVAILNDLISGGTEIFQDVITLYEAGKGDCDRLVGVRLAELWNAGFAASPYLIPYPNETGGVTYHAVVLHRDGSSEDPSAILGMPCPPGKLEEEIRKNEERHAMLMQELSVLYAAGAPEHMLGAIAVDAAFVPPGGFRVRR